MVITQGDQMGHNAWKNLASAYEWKWHFQTKQVPT